MRGFRWVMLPLVLAGLGAAGCASTTAKPAGQPITTTPPATTAPMPSAPSPGPATPPAAAGTAYLTGIRVGEHAGYDRVVFQFTRGIPRYGTNYVAGVAADPKAPR